MPTVTDVWDDVHQERQALLASLFHATAVVTGEADVAGVEVAGKSW